MKKKITAMLVCAAVILSLTACSSDSESSSPETSTKSGTESSKTESSSTVSSSSTESSTESKPEESSAPEESTSSTESSTESKPEESTSSAESSSAPEETSAPETGDIDWSTIPVVDEIDLRYEVYNTAYEFFYDHPNLDIANEMEDRGKDSAVLITEYYGDAEYINLPDSIEGIDFIICSANWGENAKAIRFPESYSSCSLGSAKNLTSADIPDSWQYVGPWSKLNLPRTKLPAEAKKICDRAFYNYIKLTNVTIPEKVEYIGVGAFAGCKYLDRVNFPEKFAGECAIHNSAFEGCTSLISIEIPEGVVPVKDTNTISYSVFSGCTRLKKVTLPSTWTIIGQDMFKDCTSLTDVKLSPGVENIYWFAFENCTSLRNIDIPDSVTYIYSDAFKGCTNISINYKGNTYNEENIKKLYERDLSKI